MRVLSPTAHRLPMISGHTIGMGVSWKILLPLALILPIGAYAVGSLVARAEEPPPRPAIVLPSSTATNSPTEGPSGKHRQDDKDDKGDKDDKDDSDDDSHVVPPEPYSDDDDDWDDDDDDRDDGDDD